MFPRVILILFKFSFVYFQTKETKALWTNHLIQKCYKMLWKAEFPIDIKLRSFVISIQLCSNPISVMTSEEKLISKMSVGSFVTQQNPSMSSNNENLLQITGTDRR